MTIAVPFNSFLSQMIVQDDSRGVLLEQISVLFKHHLNSTQGDMSINQGVFLPLTEMFLLKSNISYQIERKGRRVLIRGIRFKEANANVLFETLTTGLFNSENSLKEAKKLHDDLFATA